MTDKQRKVEAILFTVGKEITSERIASLCGIENIKEVDSIVQKLQAKYAALEESSLQVVKKEYGWKLTVRDQFVPLVSSVVKSTELDVPLMQTLAVIAWKYPVVQSEVIKLRNQSAYEHMRLLGEQGFITKEKFGRTFKVKLTKKFFEYFDLPSEDAKKAFLDEVPEEVLQEAENVDKEADEVERLIDIEKNEEEGKDELKEAMEDMQN
jgi:segregation and condensation protein B